jgi:signal transduction histidine kinase
MLDNVRTVNQSEHKVLPFTPETVDLKRFLQQLESEVTNIQHPEQILTIHSNIYHEIIQFDPNLMQQALLNLLQNAIKYSPDNGKIDLHMSLSQEFLNIKIQDEGIGIHDSELVRMYQPFYRGENVAHIRGTGIGFSNCQKSS